jgi:Na+/H+ antiporter NhaC
MFRFIALFVILLLIVGGAWFGRPDPDFLARQWAISRTESALKRLANTLPAGDKPRVALLLSPTNDPLRQAIEQRVRVPGGVWADSSEPGVHRLALDISTGPHTATVRYAIDQGAAVITRVGWYSVLPPLLAITTAIVLRRVVLCLGLGILAGGVIAIWPTDQTFVRGAWYAFDQYLIRHALLDQFRMEILTFIILISAIVGIAQYAGGIHGMIEIIVKVCRTSRAAQLGAMFAGIAVFFDDYLNCIIVGNSFRPLTDRFRVSREKLAYIVDSTAAPVAGLAVVSTWIAFEVTQIGEGLRAAGLHVEPFSIFIGSLPYRFYCILTLVFVFALAWMGRDYGPMLAAERRARREGSTTGPQAGVQENVAKVGKARYAVIPIGFTILATFVGLWWTAQPGPGEQLVARGDNAFAMAVDYIQQILARTNSARAFARASILGYVLTLMMVLGGRIMTVREIAIVTLKSARVISGAVVILFLAWAIGAACRDVGTADYLVALFREVLNPVGFSLIVFGLACVISFATGTSYGTMAILLPNVVPLALAVGEHSSLTGMGLVVMSVGAVLEGSIFGDHCSPISDTTILSAIASQCELMDHVRTQMPYAVTSMLLAAFVGYIPVTLGIPAWVSLIAGVLLVLAIVRLIGRPVDLPRCKAAAHDTDETLESEPEVGHGQDSPWRAREKELIA